MAKLCIYLPPFASDYSGVCSALFELDCLTAINDASCCTAHYVYGDEPRWEKRTRPVFSTQLRTVDAILGNDDKVADCVLRASEAVDTALIALIGTPVPALTGMDMEGIASEIESRSGKITLGFNTTGFRYYDGGVAAVGRRLIDRLAAKDAPRRERSVNIVGMTPLDYGDAGNDTDLRGALHDAGWNVNACLFMGTSFEELGRLGGASLTLAVSSAGLAIAKHMSDRFKIPYVAAAPMGLDALDEALGEPGGGGAADGDGAGDGAGSGARVWAGSGAAKALRCAAGRALLVMDQVMGVSMRRALYKAGCESRISVASFFGWDGALAQDGDFFIPDEKALIQALRRGEYHSVVGDPMLAGIPDMKSVQHIELVHPALSGKLRWNDQKRYLSKDFEAFLLNAAQRLSRA